MRRNWTKQEQAVFKQVDEIRRDLRASGIYQYMAIYLKMYPEDATPKAMNRVKNVMGKQLPDIHTVKKLKAMTKALKTKKAA